MRRLLNRAIGNNIRQNPKWTSWKWFERNEKMVEEERMEEIQVDSFRSRVLSHYPPILEFIDKSELFNRLFKKPPKGTHISSGFERFDKDKEKKGEEKEEDTKKGKKHSNVFQANNQNSKGPNWYLIGFTIGLAIFGLTKLDEEKIDLTYTVDQNDS